MNTNPAPAPLHDPLRLGNVLSAIDWVAHFDSTETVNDSEGFFSRPVPAGVLWNSRSTRWAVLSERGYPRKITLGESQYALLVDRNSRYWVIERAETGLDMFRWNGETPSPFASIRVPVAQVRPSEWPEVITTVTPDADVERVQYGLIQSLDEAARLLVFEESPLITIFPQREVVEVGSVPSIETWKQLVSEISSYEQGESQPIVVDEARRSM